MASFYEEFYTRIAHSAAHSEFCWRVYGRDLGQHGMLDMEQLALMLQELRLAPGARVLELGCGNGRLTQLVAELTGAHITGLDLSATGIAYAQELVQPAEGGLDFVCADMAKWVYPQAVYDVIYSVDSVQFVPDLPALFEALRHALRPGGLLAVFFSAWAAADDPEERLLPDSNRMGSALRTAGWTFEVRSLREQEIAHWQRKFDVLQEMRAAFEAEGNSFIYERRLLEAEYQQQHLKTGRVARYLYLARPGT